MCTAHVNIGLCQIFDIVEYYYMDTDYNTVHYLDYNLVTEIMLRCEYRHAILDFIIWFCYLLKIAEDIPKGHIQCESCFNFIKWFTVLLRLE